MLKPCCSNVRVPGDPTWPVFGWLTVGNKLACGQAAANICLHINRSDRPDKDCCRYDYNTNYYLDYKDGELLTEAQMDVVDALIALRLQEPATVLVHCNAGGCRSPTIAAYILAAVERTLDPLEAFFAVERAIYQTQQKLCNIVYQPKEQLVARIYQRRGLTWNE